MNQLGLFMPFEVNLVHALNMINYSNLWLWVFTVLTGADAIKYWNGNKLWLFVGSWPSQWNCRRRSQYWITATRQNPITVKHNHEKIFDFWINNGSGVLHTYGCPLKECNILIHYLQPSWDAIRHAIIFLVALETKYCCQSDESSKQTIKYFLCRQRQL